MESYKIGLTTLIIFISIGASAFTAQKISVSDDVMRSLKSFEPSATLYLEDLNTFLVAIDDTNKKNEPILFLMDEKGHIENSVTRISGISKMTDIESISQDKNKNLYFLSSQSLNKSGKEINERSIFARAARTGKNINSRDSIRLRPILLKALQNSSSANLKIMRREFENDLDVESHFTRRGELYVGLKNPQPWPGAAVIVKAGNINEIFSNSKLNLKEWRVIDFAGITGEPDLLSDIYPVSGRLLLTTTQEGGPGRLWSYDEDTDKLTLLKEFTHLHPEGLAFNPLQNSGMIVFDEGVNDAFFATGRF